MCAKEKKEEQKWKLRFLSLQKQDFHVSVNKKQKVKCVLIKDLKSFFQH
jgi:hypothetical protein